MPSVFLGRKPLDFSNLQLFVTNVGEKCGLEPLDRAVHDCGNRAPAFSGLGVDVDAGPIAASRVFVLRLDFNLLAQCPQRVDQFLGKASLDE